MSRGALSAEQQRELADALAEVDAEEQGGEPAAAPVAAEAAAAAAVAAAVGEEEVEIVIDAGEELLQPLLPVRRHRRSVAEAPFGAVPVSGDSRESRILPFPLVYHTLLIRAAAREGHRPAGHPPLLWQALRGFRPGGHVVMWHVSSVLE